MHGVPCLALSALLVAGCAIHAPEVPTGRLPRAVVPTRYALTLEIDPAADGFAGEVRIAALAAAPAGTLFLHAKDLEIVRASATPEGGAPIALRAEPVHESGVLALRAATPLPAGALELALAFRGTYSTRLEATYKVTVGERAYVLTQHEPLAARRSFPCFDEPAFKTPWDVTLVVPEAAAAASNAPVLREERGGGRRRVVFASTEPLPSYLVAYAVGPWDVVEASAIPPTPERADALPLRGLAAHGRGGELAHALAETPRVLAALEAWFGAAHPFAKLDLVAAPDFAFGAMENAGLIVYQDRLLLVGPHAPTALRQAFFGVHVHELAHQWFGNLVTMPWWNDVWLNEAFATWLAAKLSDELEPGHRAGLHLLEGARWAMGEDRLATARRIAEPVDDYRDVISAFDGVTYQKGAAVLGMFESYLGAERFRGALRAHLRRFARANASSADLIDSLAAGPDDAAGLRRAFRSFLDQPGTPQLDVALACRGDRPALEVRQQRDLPLGSTATAAQRWGIPLCVRLGNAGAGATKHCTLLEAESAVLPLPAGECPRWVMPNAGGAGYYRFTQPEADHAALESAWAELDDREQLMAADSVSAAFYAGRLPPEQLLRALPGIAASRSWPAAAVPLDALEWLHEHLAGEVERAGLDALVRRVYGPRLAALSLDPREGEPDEAKLERQALVGVLARANDSALRGELLRRARAALALELDPVALAPDLRASALSVLAQDGSDAEFGALAEALRSAEDGQLRRDLVNALASGISPGRAAAARTLALDPALRAGELGGWLARHFAWRENRVEGRAWLGAHLDVVLGKLPPVSAPQAASAHAAGACSEDEARATDAIFGERLAGLEGGPRALAQLDEMTRLCAALRLHLAKANFSPGG